MVVPSVGAEAFGLTVAAAMARGRPVAATHVGGIPEIIEDGVSGLLVPPNDPDALAEAIRKILIDPTVRDSLGHAASMRIARDFTVGQQVSNIASLVTTVLGRG